MNCPYCKEEIQDGARVCRHCGQKQNPLIERVKLIHVAMGLGLLIVIAIIFANNRAEEARAQLARCGASSFGIPPSQLQTAVALACGSSAAP